MQQDNQAGSRTRQRIAVLGSGMAALSAVVALTGDQGWQDRFDITVYQLGWRPGGKGASGRNRARADRIEEHGLHVWFGCYDHAFRLLRSCYQELDRPPDCPIRSIDEAFEAKDQTPYMQQHHGHWVEWPVYFPPNDQVPGVDERAFTVWDYVRELTKWVEHQVGGLFHASRAESRTGSGADGGGAHDVPAWVEAMVPALPAADGPAHETLAHKLTRLVNHLDADPSNHADEHHRGITWLASEVGRWFHKEREKLKGAALEQERAAIGVDLALTLVRGFIADGVVTHGFEAIDRWDTREWLRRHGARDFAVDSAPIRALYDLCFAYENGDIERPNFAAGPGLHAVLRIAFQYRGHVVYEMNAGMGDVVIAPIYQLLKQRGVRFEFFRRVERLEPSSDGCTIERIHVGRQVDLLVDEYEPLVDVGGLPCFPSEPLLQQIREGNSLKGVNLESRWSGWTDAGHDVLERGVDFDQIVLGISLEGVKEVCAELAELDSDVGLRWSRMFREVGTVQTLGVQLWLERSLDDLGWESGAIPVDAAPEPLDVWADRTALLARENWSGNGDPKSLQYLCGPLPGDFAARPPSDLEVPEEAAQAVRAITRKWLEEYGPVLWPKATVDGSFDWRVLAAGDEEAGAARLNAQYLSANVDPSERYVLSLSGSGAARMGADESGVDNLVLTGDWTRTSWNAGCIEACTLAGENAAAAVRKSAMAASMGDPDG